MAIDDRFSKTNFEDDFARDPESRKLADELEAEVMSAIQGSVAHILRLAVDRLNELGHQLTEYYPPEPGDIAYRDDQQKKCELRLGIHVLVMAGYKDTIDPDPS